LVPREKVTTLVLGEARHADDTEAPITIKQNEFAEWLRKQFPAIELVRIDERNTSQLAAEALYQGGMRKSQRQIKENLDKVSAAIILQLYLNS
jgi:putative Holliday junction resolvase